MDTISVFLKMNRYNLEMIDSSKLYYLLGTDYAQWTCNNPDYYNFITPNLTILKIIEVSKEFFDGLADKVIWDMFSGIGCDAVRFAAHAGKVICTEINPKTYADLAVNTSNKRNIEIRNADCCNLDINCNIVYFDPPWGDTYRSGEQFDFSAVILADGRSVLSLAQEVSLNRNMIIKAPISSDSFEELFGDRIGAVLTFTQQKLKFLFILAPDED
jgi:predicted RNA methylase